MRILSLVILVIALVSVPVMAFDLTHYPTPFVSGGQFYGVLVIGDHAAAGDTIGAIEIATSLQFLVSEKISSPVVLASELDSVKHQNAIVIGGPCANPAAAELLDYPEDCASDFWGKSVVQLFEHEGFVQILVAGGSELDTRRAARILASYEDNSDLLNGTYVEVRKVIESVTNLNVELTE